MKGRIYLLAMAMIFAAATARAQGDNAASCYSEALTLLQYPTTEGARQKIEGIAKNGWREPFKEMEALVGDNEPCLGAVKKAAAITTCNFGSPPPLNKLQDLDWMILLSCRYFEQRGDIKKAADLYFSSLALASHVGQDGAAASKMLALRLEKNTYFSLRNTIESCTVDQDNLERITQYLDTYQKRRFPAADLVEAQKGSFMAVVQTVADDIIKKSGEQSGSDAALQQKAQSVAGEFLKQRDQLADKYYGNFKKAAETNSEVDWDLASQEVEAVRKALDPNPLENVKDISGLLIDSCVKVQTTEEPDRQYVKKIVKAMLVKAIPDFTKPVASYYSNVNDLEGLKSLIRWHLNRFKADKEGAVSSVFIPEN